MAMTTRSPDDLVAELDDGRIVWPPMPRPRFIGPRRVAGARASIVVAR